MKKVLVVGVLVASVLSAGRASAASITQTLGNTCRIAAVDYPWSPGQVQGYRQASTTEVQNCSEVQVVLQWWNQNLNHGNGGFTLDTSNYASGPEFKLDYTNTNLGYSDHNGRNCSGCAAQGFRINHA